MAMPASPTSTKSGASPTNEKNDLETGCNDGIGYAAIRAGGRHSVAAEVPRAQPGRERRAVHARQLALHPQLQILRRSRRPLLCGMEQARRPALAHHVHRTAPMGPRVLINGIWYYSTSFNIWKRAAWTCIWTNNQSTPRRRWAS